MKYKLLLTIALAAALSSCNKQDAKAAQTDPAQTVSTPAVTPVSQAPADSTVAPATVAESTEPPLQQAQPVVIPASTHIRVRLEQTVDTKRNRAGDRFEATLISPIEVDGKILVPRGTTFEGHVTEARPSGRFKGRAVLGLRLDSFQMNNAVYRVATATDTRVSGRHRKRNWILMGGGSGFGATVGAVAGGGPGALIGAGAGAGAGAVGAFITGRKNVTLPVETPLTFRLRTDVVLTS